MHIMHCTTPEIACTTPEIASTTPEIACTTPEIACTTPEMAGKGYVGGWAPTPWLACMTAWLHRPLPVRLGAAWAPCPSSAASLLHWQRVLRAPEQVLSRRRPRSTAANPWQILAARVEVTSAAGFRPALAASASPALLVATPRALATLPGYDGAGGKGNEGRGEGGMQALLQAAQWLGHALTQLWRFMHGPRSARLRAFCESFRICGRGCVLLRAGGLSFRQQTNG